VPVVIGGIEASLRRIAHYDYWQDKVRRSILVDSKADLLLYGNAERAIVEVAHRLAARKPIESITDVRGTAFMRRPDDAAWAGSRSTPPRSTSPAASTRSSAPTCRQAAVHGGLQEERGADGAKPVQIVRRCRWRAATGAVTPPRERTVIRLPSYEQVKSDPVLYAHANRVLHLETNPGNARALVQRHGEGRGARRLDQPAADPAEPRPRWTMCSTCPTRAARTRAMPTSRAATTARPRSRPGR
jgi:radical SAM superfamily enzyme YgiQ (UPF0313 family)